MHMYVYIYIYIYIIRMLMLTVRFMYSFQGGPLVLDYLSNAGFSHQKWRMMWQIVMILDTAKRA